MVSELLEVLDVSVADLADHEVALALARPWLPGLHRWTGAALLSPRGGTARQRGDGYTRGTDLTGDLNNTII